MGSNSQIDKAVIEIAEFDVSTVEVSTLIQKDAVEEDFFISSN